MRIISRLAVTFVIASLAFAVRAQVTPVGLEFRANTYTTGNQRDPALCRDVSGNFVVVWEDQSGEDGDAYGVFGQRFSNTGSRLGTEFQVNSFTSGDQGDPGICCDLSGNFVAVWQSRGQHDGDNFGVFGQRFTNTAAKLGSEFQINTFTTDRQQEPVVTCDSAGNFVVVWESGKYDANGQDGSGYGVFGQRFSSAAAKLGTEFQVNTYTTNNQNEPVIAENASGGFVVVWSSGLYAGGGQDGDFKGVFGQRFASTGGKLGTEFQVNTYTTRHQDDPGLCSDAAGNFVVVWQSGYYNAPGTQDGDGYGIFGQRFASSGGKLGGEFQLNTFTSNNQTEPVASCDTAGNFVVVWSSQSQDGNHSAAIARLFSNSGLPKGSEIQINTYTTGNQQDPMVLLGSGGGFIVAWESDPIRKHPIPQPVGGLHPRPEIAGPQIPSQDGDDDGVFVRQFVRTGSPAPALTSAGLVIAGVALLITGWVLLVLRRRVGKSERS